MVDEVICRVCNRIKSKDECYHHLTNPICEDCWTAPVTNCPINTQNIKLDESQAPKKVLQVDEIAQGNLGDVSGCSENNVVTDVVVTTEASGTHLSNLSNENLDESESSVVSTLDETTFENSWHLIEGVKDLTYNYLYEVTKWHTKEDIVDAIGEAIKELKSQMKAVLEVEE